MYDFLSVCCVLVFLSPCEWMMVYRDTIYILNETVVSESVCLHH